MLLKVIQGVVLMLRKVQNLQLKLVQRNTSIKDNLQYIK